MLNFILKLFYYFVYFDEWFIYKFYKGSQKSMHWFWKSDMSWTVGSFYSIKKLVQSQIKCYMVHRNKILNENKNNRKWPCKINFGSGKQTLWMKMVFNGLITIKIQIN